MTLTKLNKWWIFLVTTSGTSLVFLDTTIMPVALPSIQTHFGFGSIDLVWIVNAYLLSLTALLPVGGRLCDLLGKRSLFMWGLAIFGLGSLIGAIAETQLCLIGARMVQGVGGALTIPATATLLIAAFPENERAKALGINTGISGIFLVLGPALGGFLTEYISWQSIFYINIPIALFGIVMAGWMLRPEVRRQESFDLLGSVTLCAFMISLVVALMQANSWGWTSPFTLSLLVISPLFLALFVKVSLKTSHPIIDFRCFQSHMFTVANITVFITQNIVMVTVLWAIYFQEQLGYSPSETGLVIFVAAFPIFLMAPLGGYCADRWGPRVPMLMGFGVLVCALAWLIVTATAKSIFVLLPGLLGFGVSLPMIMSPTVALALTQVNPEKLGEASGIYMATRQVASTIGIALMTALYLGVLNASHSHVEAFFAISMLAGALACVGFVIVFCAIKQTALVPNGVPHK